MRVLIITHPRSGGRSLSEWIAKELNLKLVHEPFRIKEPEVFINSVYTEEDIVVKVIYEKLWRRYIDIYDLAKRFDKVILHVRKNDKDVAISMIYQLLNPQKGGYEEPNWHKVYQIDDEWMTRNQNMINKELAWIEKSRVEIETLKMDSLSTTYENIYENTDDISRLMEFLNIKESYHLDVLDKRHRLKNGDVGMSDYIDNSPPPVEPPRTLI